MSLYLLVSLLEHYSMSHLEEHTHLKGCCMRTQCVGTTTFIAYTDGVGWTALLSPHMAHRCRMKLLTLNYQQFAPGSACRGLSSPPPALPATNAWRTINITEGMACNLIFSKNSTAMQRWGGRMNANERKRCPRHEPGHTLLLVASLNLLMRVCLAHALETWVVASQPRFVER
eukprot:154833-Amphidinium_carterae.1